MNTPTIVRIRQRYGRDRGASKDAPSIWMSYDAHLHQEAGILADADLDIGV